MFFPLIRAAGRVIGSGMGGRYGWIGKRRRNQGEGGAVLVEAAFVISLILAPLTFGAVEASFMVSHANALSDASRAAARVGAASFASPTEDYYILRAAADDTGLTNQGEITKVIIYRAASPDGVVPTGCEIASIVGECNVYTAADLQEPKSVIDLKQTFWAPSTRLADVNGDMPYLGVKIVATHEWVTGWSLGAPILSGTQIMRIEPITSYENTTVTPNSGYTPYVYTGV